MPPELFTPEVSNATSFTPFTWFALFVSVLEVPVAVWHRSQPRLYFAGSVWSRWATESVEAAPPVPWQEVQVVVAPVSQLIGTKVFVPPSGAALEWQ